MEDDLKLEIGKEFENLEEAWNFWNEYSRKVNFGVRKYNGTKSKKDISISISVWNTPLITPDKIVKIIFILLYIIFKYYI